MISAKILAHSTSAFGEVVTFELNYPRIIHAELMTHRMFSRNAASSRAIPFDKMCQSIVTDMFTPIKFQKAHTGMQGNECYEGDELGDCRHAWQLAGRAAVIRAKDVSYRFKDQGGITKQLLNRMLEPYQYYKVIVTTSKPGLQNFFDLRISEHAEIHIDNLAKRMEEVYLTSTPKALDSGEWHLPFAEHLPHNLPTITKLMVCIARCARISYQCYGTNPVIDIAKDLKLFKRLYDQKHASPFEHVAMAMSQQDADNNFVMEQGLVIPAVCRNFTGFIPARVLFEDGSLDITS